MRIAKRAKLAVALIQVALTVTVFALARQSDAETYLSYWIPAQKFLASLHFPLLVILQPVGYLFDLITTQLQLTRETERVIAGLFIVPSVGAFWYFVVAEVEKRLSGDSFLRFHRRIPELLVIAALFATGIGVFAYEYFADVRELRMWWHSGRTLAGAFLIGLPASVLLMWGVTLVGIAVVDFLNLRSGGRRSA